MIGLLLTKKLQLEKNKKYIGAKVFESLMVDLLFSFLNI
jgi:hypothetical protein